MESADSIDQSSSNSQDCIMNVRTQLLQEGREARNLVAYSVPVQQNKTTVSIDHTNKISTFAKESKKSSINTHKQDKRHRSVSTGRNSQASLRARHWGFLFRNLEQAVDEIYQTCEDDESIIECKESILMLERYTKDFHKLIEWLKLKWEFEKTPPPQRPASVCWEIRTSSTRSLSSRRKYPLFSPPKEYGVNGMSQLTVKNVSAKYEQGNQSRSPLISQDCDRKSPLPKLSTVEEIENSEKLTNKEEDNSKYELLSNNNEQPSAGDKSLKNHTVSNTTENLKPNEIKEHSQQSNTLKNLEKTLEERRIKTKSGQSDTKKLEDKDNQIAALSNANTNNVAIIVAKDPKDTKIFINNQMPKKASGHSLKDVASAKEEEKFSIIATRSKSTTNLKSIINPKVDLEAKKVSLTGPTVNMNKASQVRQAYNQNKVPQKSTKPIIWKNFVANNGSELGPSKQVKPYCSPSKWTMNRTGESIWNTNSHRKYWNNYPRNSESLPTSRILVRSATTLAESQITKNTTTDISMGYDSKIRNECSRSSCSLASTTSSGQSWADKVKGPGKDCEVEQSQATEAVDDNEGWEVVRRGRRSESSLSLGSRPKTKERQISNHNAFRLNMQKRFNQPTSAVSLPSLINETSSQKTPSQLVDTKCNTGNSLSVSSSPSKVEMQKKAKPEDAGVSLNKSEKNICNHIRREESKAVEAEIINENKPPKGTKTTRSSSKIENRKARKEFICENTSDSEREEEEMTKNEALFATAIKEELRLKKQIEETETNPYEIFVEEEVEISSDDTQTLQEDETPQEEHCDRATRYVDQACSIFPSTSWADMGPMDNLRHPGRVLHIHEKLSSPAKHLTSSEKLKKHREKLAKAEDFRQNLIHEKTEKIKDLFRRIEEVNIDKDRLLLEKRHMFERKMARAEEKRKRHLQQIVNKAHDEENKAREIAFINDLEAQNKLHDILQQQQSHESRLAYMAEERSRKLEEKAAKEAAAQERRKAIEAERQARMAALCEKRRRRCERIDRLQAERREELLEQARDKARDREERLSALQQAQQAKETELVMKIQQKQEETARRHEENIQLIRQKGLEYSITRCSRGCDDAPKLLRYEIKKLCTLCNSLIASEVYLLSHLKGRKHQDALKDLYKDEASNEQTAKYNLKHIIDAPENIDDPELSREQERQKSLRKKCRKIKARMVSQGVNFLKEFKYPASQDSKLKSRMTKPLQQIGKLVTSQGSGPWPASDVSALDKNVLDLYRLLDKGDGNAATIFLSLEGFGKLNAVLDLITTTADDQPCVLPAKSLSYVIRVLHAACVKFFLNCEYVLQSNYIVRAIDQLSKRITELADQIIKQQVVVGSPVELFSDPVCTGLMEIIGYTLHAVLSSEEDGNDISTQSMNVRIKEVVSYLVSVGVVDKLTWYFNRVQEPVDNDQPTADFILASLKILSNLTSCLTRVPALNDPTQLINTIQVTDSFGVASLLYGLLLQVAERSMMPPSDYFSVSTLAITDAGTILLCNLAQLDLKLFQSILGSEGISLELRHICSFLLWYCSHWPSEKILHNVIILVGFFTVNNKDNQSIMQSGETPSVLQQLCNLPWNYFTDSRLTSVLFPTLLACCLDNPDNMRIIETDMSFQILQEFLTKKEAADRPLVKVLHKMQNIQ